MSALELARLQFATTTIFHFFFVPVSIGLAFYVAVCQTLHYRTGREVYARQVAFCGKLMLISFAVGVVTGHHPGVPVRHELVASTRASSATSSARRWRWRALAAFFLESTFLGLWIFGKGRVSPAGAPRVDLARLDSARCSRRSSSSPPTRGCSIPVGYKMVHGRPRLTASGPSSRTTRRSAAFAHVLLRGAHHRGRSSSLAVAACQLRVAATRSSVFGARGRGSPLPIVAVGVVGGFVVGDQLALLLVEQQPMKMAAAEALFETEQPAGVLASSPPATSRANPGRTRTAT